MKKIIQFPVLLGVVSLISIPELANGQENIEQKIETLLNQMTLEEKIGQTAQRGFPSWNKGPLSDDLRDAVKNGQIGSFLNVMDKDIALELQRIAVEESRLGIPLIYGRDVIHGFRTIFPIPLGLSATWDTALIKNTAKIAAIEATTYGIRWTFAPMLDISRDPRWGRIAESPGEDPFLGAAIAKAYVQGFQGESPGSPQSIAACAKHFAGYGAAEGGRDYNTTYIPEQLLRDIYLVPFEAANNAGVLTYMTSFNEINGVPSSGNDFLLRTILRDEWKFDGFVVSDWNAITEMIAHGFCSDKKDAAKKAAIGGVDMEMVSTAYEDHLKKLINEGLIAEKTLDEFVRNILRVKFKLGLFDNPYFKKDNQNILLNKYHLDLAKKSATESIVLLKNDNTVLPLKNNSLKIALIGPMCDAAHEQMGTWSFDGKDEDVVTPLKAFQGYYGKNLLYSKGLEYSRDKSRDGFTDAIEKSKKADVILFFGGEEAILSGEAHSRADISLPGAQEALIKELHKTGKPVILIILAGRPIVLENITDYTNAIVMAWHPGTMGGPALLDIVNGKTVPGGRLTVSWPVKTGQIPIYYNHKNTGRPPQSDNFVHIDDIPVGTYQSSLGNTSHYLDAGFKPMFPFGYGLSYTSFSYTGLQLSDTVMHSGDSIIISANITNTGSVAASEVAQLYTRDLVGDITRPVRELKGFKRIYLEPGESKKVDFTLKPENLTFHNRKMEKVTEPGGFYVWIGPNAQEGLQGKFKLVTHHF